MATTTGISDEDRAIIKYLDDSHVPHVITATTDHSILTTSGNTSRHVQPGTNGKGLAVDAEGPHGGSNTAEHLAIWQAYTKVESQLYELIYAGAPYQIKAGKRVSNSYYGVLVMSQHHNHVHAAVNKGVFIKWPDGAPIPVPPPEPPPPPYYLDGLLEGKKVKTTPLKVPTFGAGTNAGLGFAATTIPWNKKIGSPAVNVSSNLAVPVPIAGWQQRDGLVWVRVDGAIPGSTIDVEVCSTD